MKRSEAVTEITNFINRFDGGSIQPYVTDHLLDFLTEELKMVHTIGKWESEDED